MNFDQYSIEENLSRTEDTLAHHAWDECKKQVLKILKDEKNQTTNESYPGFGFVHINPSVLAEIENL